MLDPYPLALQEIDSSYAKGIIGSGQMFFAGFTVSAKVDFLGCACASVFVLYLSSEIFSKTESGHRRGGAQQVQVGFKVFMQDLW